MVNQKQNIIMSKNFYQFFKEIKFIRRTLVFKRIIIRNKDFCTEHLNKNNDRRVKRHPYLS